MLFRSGQTFHGRLATAPVDQTPERQEAAVVSGANAVTSLLRQHRREVDFPLMVPTKIERSSWIDSELPILVYKIDPDKEHSAVRLTYRLAGGNQYWGVQMTDWEDAPVLSGRNFVRRIGGGGSRRLHNRPTPHLGLRPPACATPARGHPPPVPPPPSFLRLRVPRHP